MKLKTKKPLVLLLGMVYALCFSFSSFGVAYAACTDAAPCRPYFKTFGADVMTGGWFYENGYCVDSPSSNYQDPKYPLNPTDGINQSPTNGGILSYAKDNGVHSAGGASSQYAAITAGGVEGDNTKTYGFYSAGALAATGPPPTVKSLLSFANSGISNPSLWSGLFEGSIRQTNCIPDYYSKILTSGATLLPSSLPTPASSGTFSSYNYSRDAGPTVWELNSGGVSTINPNTSVTVYIKGNVYIGNNIQYAAYSANNVPKFALVVEGSIYIAPSVTRLDGVYIAQPLPDPGRPNGPVTTDTGNIWTCHDATTNSAQYNYSSVGTCANPLVVYGALIAKQVMLMRTKGDIAGASTAEDNLGTAIGNVNVAEIINYTPAMVIGGPFFDNSSTNNIPEVDSLISLPPVF